ncbi:uncharacterized protein I303_104081 [Kwoniella dejecticola CBS 10117]|uniref:RNI-like protein n=1 Tax=Kwoniella dejecticola CBS 10117 TaxID=1296121 RepID=A0A1A6A8J3_9TREE|nr:uncharacterized protein I303_04100 [Kwoniella dejecticola CBS 10117]OBR86376.1 hypothetical protein I303_04100 [Kwoniella dejecticola CBS 10117]
MSASAPAEKEDVVTQEDVPKVNDSPTADLSKSEGMSTDSSNSQTTSSAATSTTSKEIVSSPPPITPTSASSIKQDVSNATASTSTLLSPSEGHPSAPSPSPAKRRPKPPTKGILKPPPPPAKPTLGNRLRDIVGGAVNTAVGTTSRLFDTPEESVAGPSSSSGSSSTNNPITPKGPSSGTSTTATASATAGATLASISGRLAGLGLSRFVPAPSTSSDVTPSNSPLPPRSVSLPETGSPMLVNGPNGLVSEKVRQKQPLKRATFVLPSLSITYPISSQGEPWSAKVIEDRQRIETNHRTLLSSSCGPEYWHSRRLVLLYETACRSREEKPRVGITRALEVIPPPPKARHIHLTLRLIDHSTIGVTAPPGGPNTLDTPFTRYSAEAFADVLSAEWGLSELKLENGVLETEESLKPILHALLISGTLPSLSLKGNKKIKSGGWRLIAVFLKRARSLKYIDLSDTTWDKKSVEYLVQALTSTQIKAQEATPKIGFSPDSASQLDSAIETKDGVQDGTVGEDGGAEKTSKDAYGSFIPPAPLLKEHEENSTPAAVQTLRLDGCGLRANVMEIVAQGVRSSDLKNISLRRNRIGPLGAVALALMIRDYPDSALVMSSLSPGLSPNPSTQSPLLVPSDSSSTAMAASPNLANASSTLPYAARIRKNQPPLPDERDLPPIPLVVSSPIGGVTSRTVPEGYKPPPPPKHPLVMPSGGNSAMQDAGNFPITAEGKMSAPELGGASIALQRSVRALDGVERIGRLLTLDLKANEIKNGVTYIAQVLKRNRTLKVLNLSDNKIETSGLVSLAEALKYNSTLETLDLSNNPCCGPSNDGISSLRTSFTVNNSLKRLFLSDTGLTTEGAISLAEFLPESKSLLHLDLTDNDQIETAGILALSVGLKSNTLIRCLDISIQPNSVSQSEISQSILQSCIRNTELAVEKSSSSSHQEAVVWGPIKKSNLVKQIKEIDQLKKDQERFELTFTPAGQAREYVYTLRPERVLIISEETLKNLQKWFEAGQQYHSLRNKNEVHWRPDQLPQEEFEMLYERAIVLKERLIEQIQDPDPNTPPENLERLLWLNDQFTNTLELGANFTPPPRLLLPSQIVPTSPSPNGNSSNTTTLHTNSSNQRMRSGSGTGGRLYPQRRHMRISSTEISSPNFSIGDSDNDSDPEELDETSFTQSTPTKTPLNINTTARSTTTPTRSNLNTNSGLGLGSIPTDLRAPASASDTGAGQEKAEEPEGLLEEQMIRTSSDQDEVEEGFLSDLTSPTEKASRKWVEEEGEVFRKGTKLGVVDEKDDTLGEEKDKISGEELRKEILETPVARSPTRRVIPLEGEEDGDGEARGEGEDDIKGTEENED